MDIEPDIINRNWQDSVAHGIRLLVRALAITLLLAGLLALPVAWLSTHIDNIKDEAMLVAAIEAETNYRVSLANFRWHWLPFGFDFEHFSLSLPNQDVAFVEARYARVAVLLWPLFRSGQLVLDDIKASGVKIYPDLALDGGDQPYPHSPIKNEAAASTRTPLITRQAPATASSLSSVIFDLTSFTLRDLAVEYQGEEQTFFLYAETLQAENIESLVAVPIRLKGRLGVEGWPNIQLRIAGQAALGGSLHGCRGVKCVQKVFDVVGKQQHVLDIGSGKLNVDERVSSPPRESRRLSLIDAYRLQVDEGELRLGDGLAYNFSMEAGFTEEFLVLDAELTGNSQLTVTDLQVTQPFADAEWQAKISFASSQLPALARLVGARLPPTFEQLSFVGAVHKTEVAGNSNIVAPDAVITLNQQRFQGKLALTLTDVLEMQAQLSGEQLDLDALFGRGEPDSTLLPTELPPAVATDAPAVAEDAGMNRHKAEFRLQLERAYYLGLSFENCLIRGRFDGQELLIQTQAESVLDGTLVAQLTLDFNERRPAPHWQLHFDARDTDMVALSDWLGVDAGIAGKVSIQMRTSMVGNTRFELLRSVQAEGRFKGGRGTLYSGGIKRQAAQVAALTGHLDTVRQWPEQIEFDRLEGSLKIDEGGDVQHLKVRLGGFEIDAQGSLDMSRSLIDLDVGFVIRNQKNTIAGSTASFLTQIEWPVRCLGSYKGELPCQLAAGADIDLARILIDQSEPGRYLP